MFAALTVNSPLLLWLLRYLCIIAFLYCSYTDLISRRIPNRIIIPLTICALLITTICGLAIQALCGGLLAGGVMFLPRLIFGKEKAGMGDVKMAALGGMLVGVDYTVTALLLTFASALFVLTPLLLFKRIGWRQTVPFAPFLAFGFIAVLGVGLTQ